MTRVERWATVPFQALARFMERPAFRYPYPTMTATKESHQAAVRRWTRRTWLWRHLTALLYRVGMLQEMGEGASLVTARIRFPRFVWPWMPRDAVLIPEWESDRIRALTVGEKLEAFRKALEGGRPHRVVLLDVHRILRLEDPDLRAQFENALREALKEHCDEHRVEHDDSS